MGKGTVLRIAADVELPSNLSKKLSLLLNEPTIIRYNQNRSLAESYQKRADSMAAAFYFILEAYPPNADYKPFQLPLLKQYVAFYRASYDFNNQSLEELQDALSCFTGQLINALMDGWVWPKGEEQKEATACLNEAEQYVLMHQGTKDVATLLPMDFNDERHYVLQWDKRLPPYSKQWLSELEAIKRQSSPTTPIWFKDLEPAEKVYVALLDTTSTTNITIKSAINNLYLTWLEQTQNTQQLTKELQQIRQRNTPLPQWFAKLKTNEQEMLHELLSSQKFISIPAVTQAIANFNDKASEYSPESFEKISLLPLWYWLLSDTQQHFLGHTLKNSSSIKDVVSFLPSRLRTLPAPANYRAHHLDILNAEGDFVEQYKERIASSHIASRDVLKLPTMIQDRHSNANLDAVLKCKKPGESVLIQTLISPSVLLQYMPRYFGDIPPDFELAEKLKKAIRSNPDAKDITHINHPFNIAKRLYYTPSDEPGCLKLLAMAKQAFTNDPSYQGLTEKYEKVLNSGFGSATLTDWNGRELFLSSYEHLLIVALQGLSYGSCVSGKDRKSIEFIHTDAMLIYKKQFNCWPNYDDNEEDRQNFIKIVVDLYTSFHAHELAGQNAPGSDGIKTPGNYWPRDVAEAIKARLGSNALNEDDRLATNNEIGRINKNLSAYIKPGKALARLSAIESGEANCQRLIDNLGLVLNEKQRFIPEHPTKYLHLFPASADEPRGIAEIRKLIKCYKPVVFSEGESSNNASAICIAASIYTIVAQRPETPGNRTDTTIQVYKLLRNLLTNPEEIDTAIEELKQIKESSFQLNRSQTEDSNMRRISSEPTMEINSSFEGPGF